MDLEKLYKPYSEKLSLPEMLSWITDQAGKMGIQKDVAELAIMEIFLEIQNGRKFMTDGCDCGCDLKNPQTHLVHTILARMRDRNKELMTQYGRLLQKKLEAAATRKPSWLKRQIMLLGGRAVYGDKRWTGSQ